MKNELKLDNPILINGEEVKVLTYDTNEITAQMFAEADNCKLISRSRQGNNAVVAEVDYGLHIYLGMAAVIAVNQPYTFLDLQKVHGNDVTKLMNIGRNFIMGVSESDSGQENSGE